MCSRRLPSRFDRARMCAGLWTTSAGTVPRAAAGAGPATTPARPGAPRAVLRRLRGDPARAEPPEGRQLKVNMRLRRLPRLRDPTVPPADAFAGTLHVNEGYQQL